MSALNFQKQFVPLIESGEKRQTIRAIRKDGRPPAHVGEPLKLYTGMRTKGCRLVGTVIVTCVERITIKHEGFTGPGVKVYHAGAAYLDEFARADGFKDWADLCAWFEKTHGLPFEGWLIRWENMVTVPPEPRRRSIYEVYDDGE